MSTRVQDIQDAVYRDKGITYLPAGMSIDDFEVDPKFREEDSDFEKFRSEMQDSDEYAKICVSRQPVDSQGNPAGRKLFQCFECGIDDYTFSQLCTRIRDEYGTGLYKIQGRGSDGKFKFHRSIGIQAPKSIGEKDGVGNAGMLIDKFSDAMDRHQTRTEMMLREMRGKSSFDPQNIIGMITALTPLIVPLFKAIVPERRSMKDELKELMLMQEFMQNMREGNGTGEQGVYGLLSETVRGFAPLFVSAIAQGKQSGTLNSDGIVQLQPKLLPNPVTEAEPVKENPVLEQHKQSLEFLLKQAKADADVRSVTEFILDAVPDEQLDILENFLRQENCIELCEQILPEFVRYREWLSGWRSACLTELEMMLDDEDEESDTPEHSRAGDATPEPLSDASGEPAPSQ